MDLNTITGIIRPASLDEITHWGKGHAWLAGGTWLFSEPQPRLDTLVDLHALAWPSLAIVDGALVIAATCRIAELDHFACPPAWLAGPLLRLCCRSLLASFKVTNVATVGGNICMALPAGALISLTVALEAQYTVLAQDGTPRTVAAAGFVTGNNRNVLQPGELLRSITIPATALTKRFAFRRASLTQLGRSAAVLIGTQRPGAGDLLLTITAATPRPIQLQFDTLPDAAILRDAIDAAIPAEDYFDDVNGTPAYKRHLTHQFAKQIRAELAAAEADR
jgi:CO/xanthine dehydrogenase FAD-binding subunit